MPNADQIEQWGKWITVAAGYFGAVSAAVLAVWRYGRSILRCLRLSDNLHARFGSDPVLSIEQTLEQAHADLGLQRLVIDILSHKTNLALYVCDAEGNCVAVNEPICELFGLDSADMLGRGWLTALPDDQRLGVYDHWSRSIANGVPYHGEYTVTNQRTGVVTECETCTYAALVKGKVVSFVGYVKPKEK
jgi:PAS domain S-box-containing protein